MSIESKKNTNSEQKLIWRQAKAGVMGRATEKLGKSPKESQGFKSLTVKANHQQEASFAGVGKPKPEA